MKERRLLFHFHTYYSFDASITLRQLARAVEKHEITHVAITEHNNLKSYRPACEYFERMGIGCELIPACEYTTDVGDIIVLFCDQQLVFDDYGDLLAQAKERDAVTCLPHPYKRAEYPEDLVNDIDLYEAVNFRGADKSFDRRPWRGKNHIFAADAHNFFDLPGIINLYPGGGKMIDVIRRETPFPLIARDDLRLTNRLSKLASKLKKRVHPYLPF